MANFSIVVLDTGTPKLRTQQSAADIAQTDSPLLVNAGTHTTAVPAVDISQTWNNAAVAFTGARFNFLGGANSAAGTLLVDFQLDGVSKVSVRKDGLLGIGTVGDGIMSVGGRVDIWANGGSRASILAGTAVFGNSIQLGGPGNSGDVQLHRDGTPNTLAQRNGTAAQAFNIYNTYTDGSNYERGFFKWSGNVLQIGTEAAGTGTVREVLLLARDRSTGTAGWLNANPGRTGTLRVHANSSSDSFWSIENGGGARFTWNGIELNHDGGSGAMHRIRCDTGRSQWGFNTNFPVSATSHTFTSVAAADVAFAVRGTTSQTGDLQRWMDASNTVFTRIDSAGRLFLTPPTSVTIPTNGELSVEMTSNTAGNLVFRGSDGTTRRSALVFI